MLCWLEFGRLPTDVSYWVSKLMDFGRLLILFVDDVIVIASS